MRKSELRLYGFNPILCPIKSQGYSIVQLISKCHTRSCSIDQSGEAGGRVLVVSGGLESNLVRFCCSYKASVYCRWPPHITVIEFTTLTAGMQVKGDIMLAVPFSTLMHGVEHTFA